MIDDHLVSVAQLREFVKLQKSVKFRSNSSKVETYKWIAKTLGKFGYISLRKRDKGIVKKYLVKMTGYSEENIDKLIRRKKRIGILIPKERTQNSFPVFYGPGDISLLADVANVTLNQNGCALKEMCKSMYYDYGDARFENLASPYISISSLQS